MIGLVAGLSYMTWSYLIERMKIDDPLDAVAGVMSNTCVDMLSFDLVKVNESK